MLLGHRRQDGEKKYICQNLNNLEISYTQITHCCTGGKNANPISTRTLPRLLTRFQHFCNFHILFISLQLQQRLEPSWDELQIIHFLSYYLLSMQQPIFWWFSRSSKNLRAFPFSFFQYHLFVHSVLSLNPPLQAFNFLFFTFLTCRMDKIGSFPFAELKSWTV